MRVRWFALRSQNVGILLAFVAAFCLIAAGQVTEQALSTVLDPPLRGVRIVVDPGHGGIDDGTQIAGQYKEKDVNLQLGLVVRYVLQRMGAEVVMTRETDRELSRFSKVYNGRHREDLAKRVQIIRESACDLWVSLHCNCSVQHPGARGPVVYFGSSQPANPVLAKAVQSRLNRINLEPFQASQRPHSAITADYYLLRNSTVPGILVEAGYLSNSLDLGLLINNQFQRAFATNLSLGIADYLHAPQPANSETALNKVIFLLPVDAEQPAGTDASFPGSCHIPGRSAHSTRLLHRLASGGDDGTITKRPDLWPGRSCRQWAVVFA